MDKGKSSVAEEPVFPDQWEVAAQAEVPENHWEYHMRKNANEGKGDAAYNGLDYVACCTHQPVCPGECKEPTFMWKRKAR